jgi:YVTN family beta-propeller protein
VYVLSNSSPNVTVIDPVSRKVVKTADLAQFTSWTANDDNNYSDGRILWLGMRNVDQSDTVHVNDAEVAALDLDTLTLTHRVPLGKDKLNVFIGKLSKTGVLYVSKMSSAQVVGLDPKTAQIVSTWDVPVNGGVACDAEVDTAGDGVERFYYPTREGNTLVALDTQSGKPLKTMPFAAGIQPWMVTSSPDHKTLWVMEDASDSNSVVDMTTLEVLKRFPTGKGPYAASFSPDGKYAFIGHRREGVMAVIDAHTFTEIQRLSLGTYARQLAVDAASRYAYVLLTQEHAIVVIELGTWKTIDRIDLGSANPETVFVRR